MGIRKFLKNNLPDVVLEPLKQAYSDMHYAAMHVVPEEWYLKRQFLKKVGYPLNLDNPKTFNEKLQWLKLHDRNPLYTKMVDKYEAKKYVADIIGEEYIIPTLGVWDNFDEIDFDKLPNQFVLKCTHDSGSIAICKDKAAFDKKAARKKLERGLRYNYYYAGGFEWPYKNVKPRIIAEKYMIDELTKELRDYKFFTFHGEPKALFVATDRMKDDETKFDFYDMEFNHLDFKSGHPNAKNHIEKPKNFDLMKKLASVLAGDTAHLRVDFYEINGRVYWGELTFYHWSGLVQYDPVEWDGKFGQWLDLNVMK
ncbi:ATP-grasp fold amidoligase family protein [Selenomonas ruminantium]|uniref:ATP-grasp fold amidoligase family protein n=1 Tax=Selenomonas ruminantium TaxID=971 RepID=UPI0026ED57B7|nr:ATP-grasp fold amidoligase family protein [Selenomonas ruminantium]